MITFKDGVDAANVHPAVWVALGVAHQLHLPYTARPIVVTAMSSTSGHMGNSYHYPASTPSRMCQAIDIRTDDIPIGMREEWAATIKKVLVPLGYDVILESPEATGKPEHLHIEYQPHAAIGDWAYYVTKAKNGDYRI